AVQRLDPAQQVDVARNKIHLRPDMDIAARVLAGKPRKLGKRHADPETQLDQGVGSAAVVACDLVRPRRYQAGDRMADERGDVERADLVARSKVERRMPMQCAASQQRLRIVS